MFVSYIDRRSMYAEANRKQKLSKQRKLNSLQDGFLGSSIFLNFDTKISQNIFFWKKCSKIQNFQNFQKTVYMYRTHMRVVCTMHAKFQIRISIFDTQMTVISVKCRDFIKINHIFGPFTDIVHKNKLHRWISEMKLNQKSAFYFQNCEF